MTDVTKMKKDELLSAYLRMEVEMAELRTVLKKVRKDAEDMSIDKGAAERKLMFADDKLFAIQQALLAFATSFYPGDSIVSYEPTPIYVGQDEEEAADITNVDQPVMAAFKHLYSLVKKGPKRITT